MSRAIRVLLKDVLVYAQKKGSIDFATAMKNLFSDMRSCMSDKGVTEVSSKFLATIKEMKIVEIKVKDDKHHITVSDKTFRIYCARNDEKKLFLVVDYWSYSEHHYCYQLLSNTIAITSFG